MNSSSSLVVVKGQSTFSVFQVQRFSVFIVHLRLCKRIAPELDCLGEIRWTMEVFLVTSNAPHIFR